MALMIDAKPEKYMGESVVWEALCKNLPDDIVVYNNREINGREYDFTLLIKNVGILIIEVKGWNAKHILSVVGNDDIKISGYNETQRSPKKQARSYRFDWVNYLGNKFRISPVVLDMVCYPFLSKKAYYEKRLDTISTEELTLFKEDLEDSDKLKKKIGFVFENNKMVNCDLLNNKNMNIIRMQCEPNFNPEEKSKELNELNESGYSVLEVFDEKLNDDKVTEIVNNYFSGTKYIIFVQSVDDLNKIVNLVQGKMEKENILLENNIFSFSDEHKSLTAYIKNEKEFRIFNMEIYCIENINIDKKTLCIFDGKHEESDEKSLKQLSENTNFNFEQYEIEHADTEKNIIVKAGAGTGKTYSMVSRISFLCNRQKNAVKNLVDDIAMVTFTNDAADNMKKKLRNLFMNYFVLTKNPKYLRYIEDIDQTQISTIHKFAKRIIQSAAMDYGLGYEFKITSSDYSKEKIYERKLNDYLIEKKKENKNFASELRMPVYKFRKLLMNFSKQLYDKSTDIKKIAVSKYGNFDAMPFFNEVIEKVIVASENEYAKNLLETNKVSLKEMMIKANEIINNNYEEKCNMKYKYLFVDEFQDTDDLQIDTFLKLQKIIGTLKLFVVGDLKQSIYRFRGATTTAFDQLNINQKEWIEIFLNTNYRTDSRLLDKFNLIFQEMGKDGHIPFDKSEDVLKSNINFKINDNNLIKRVIYDKKDKLFYNQLFEIINKQVKANEIINKSERLSKEENTIAILVRENWQINEILREAKKRKVKVIAEVGGDLYKSAPVIDLYKLCLAILNSTDVICLYNLINSSYIDAKVDILGLHGATKEEKLKFLTKILDDYFTQYMDLTWEKLIVEIKNKSVLKVLKSVNDNLQPWRVYSEDDDEANYYRANLELVLEKIVKHYSIDYLTINTIANNLKINIVTRQEENARDIEVDDTLTKIICTTIHKSKGLEYGTVILPYTNKKIDTINNSKLDVSYLGNGLAYAIKLDGSIPATNSNYDKNTEENERVKEESRVFYVALTRTIRNFIWLKDVEAEHQIALENFMEVL